MDRNITQPPLRTQPLSVDVVGNEIFLDGAPQVEVSLTPDAAIETGIRLVNAGIGLEVEATD